VGGLFSGKSVKAEQSVQNNSQNMPILQATVSPDLSFARGGGDITVLGDGSLLPETGYIGTQADIGDESVNSGQISIYIVREGNSLGQIAKMFGVSVNTIKWANDIKDGTITPGQKLIILPVSGIQYDIKKGDTVKSVAKKFKADVGEILTFNGLSEDSELNIGDTIIIPDGEVAPTPTSKPRPTSKVRGAKNVPNYTGYYTRPISYEEGHKTQGIHGYNGVDIGASTGTSIHASAEGDVIVSRNSGYNGGYGKYIVIQHNNGTQTLYGHMSAAVVPEGAHVTQGQIIGFVGNTGHSTGPHVHFEIRGAKNPF
jgi:murein DD-endopeptidase MepM/ murein hydrolase activator NlpD